MTREQENNNTRSGSNLIKLSENTVGNTSSTTDVDYYKLLSVEKGVYKLTFSSPSAQIASYSLSVFSDSGFLIAAYEIGRDASLYTPIPSTGDYYISIAPINQFRLVTDDYNFTLSSTPLESNNFESESNDRPESPTILSINSNMTGQLSSNKDIDIYRFSVNAPAVYSLTIKPPTESLIEYLKVGIYDSAGKLLAQHYVGYTEQAIFAAKISGSYYVAVESSDNPYTYTSDEYQLQLSLTDRKVQDFEYEYNDDRYTANPINQAATVFGQIAEPGDNDYYQVEFSTPGIAEVTFTSPIPAAIKLPVFRLSMYDSSGTLQSSYLTGPSNTLLFPINRAGGYSFSVAAGSDFFYDNDLDTSTSDRLYGFSASLLPQSPFLWEIEPNNTEVRANILNTGVITSGQLSTYSDLDYYSLVTTEPT
jgi:hypothetical protein